MTQLWHQWFPGFDTGHLKLGYVKSTLPAIDSNDLPGIIRFIENPGYPTSFPGAITLDRHDCMHVLLGRGLLLQDEAFVIGYTMGAAKDTNWLYRQLFKLIARFLYRKPYRFDKEHMRVFDLAFLYAREHACAELHEVPLEQMLEHKIDEVRAKLGIRTESLMKLYREEVILLPGTKASRRLLGASLL